MSPCILCIVHACHHASSASMHPTCILTEAKNKQWMDVRTMLEADPTLINVQPALRWTALHQAAFLGRPDMVVYLLEKRADVQALTQCRQTPLDVACVPDSAHNPMVEKLLKSVQEGKSPSDALKLHTSHMSWNEVKEGCVFES